MYEKTITEKPLVINPPSTSQNKNSLWGCRTFFVPKLTSFELFDLDLACLFRNTVWKVP